ncbi:glycine cleavage system protein R [Ferrimonas marina]|uniref:Glycine cleavage system transcriptional repressor n=1 Tax=Ferrimonas marina TaxID=299255 RepID=A0A1M5RG77_9GAMM|nr:ACT domain-containing protein [Ferrimonas marina]SHH24773.1 glycine cleavage system transcriptional repressor [Ferrimonas marina]
MTQFLAVTAMGTDRPGIVNELAKLTAGCDCDIIDSRVAIFGNEFSLIMLVGGDYAAVTRLESELPVAAATLDLMTICKRTSRHHSPDYTGRLAVEFEGEDKRGTMRQITQFVADRNLDLAGFSSHAEKGEGSDGQQKVEVRINVTDRIDREALEQSLTELAQSMGLSCRIRRMEHSETE